jgi:hypothetical protein
VNRSQRREISCLARLQFLLCAAKATFALNAGVWFRRARFFIVAPDSQAKHAYRQAEIPLNALFKIPEPPHPLMALPVWSLNDLLEKTKVKQLVTCQF